MKILLGIVILIALVSLMLTVFFLAKKHQDKNGNMWNKEKNDDDIDRYY